MVGFFLRDILVEDNFRDFLVDRDGKVSSGHLSPSSAAVSSPAVPSFGDITSVSKGWICRSSICIEGEWGRRRVGD